MFKKPSKFNSSGFTIIEILVILGVMSFISTILIINTHSGEQQVILFREQARVISILSRAKSLSISTLGETGEAGASIPCGYGVHFDSDRFFIFKNMAGDCKSADHIYTDANDEIFGEIFQLDPAVGFSSLSTSDTLDMLFVPPDPSVFITSSAGEPVEDATIIMKAVRTGATVNIKINSAGQIST